MEINIREIKQCVQELPVINARNTPGLAAESILILRFKVSLTTKSVSADSEQCLKNLHTSFRMKNNR